MSKRAPLWDVLSEDQKKRALERIMAYFLDELDQRIGLIAAEQVLDTVLAETFNDVYNKGVKDAQKLIQERAADVHVELDLLLRNN